MVTSMVTSYRWLQSPVTNTGKLDGFSSSLMQANFDMFYMILYSTPNELCMIFISLWSKLLVHSSWQHCFSSLRFTDICWWTALFGQFSQVEVWSLTGPEQHVGFFFFNHSAGNLLLCLESLFCCMTQLGRSFSCQPDSLTLGYFSIQRKSRFHQSKVTRQVVAKQPQTLTTPPPCLVVDFRCSPPNPWVALTQRMLFQKSSSADEVFAL